MSNSVSEPRVLEAENITKIFGNKVVVDNVSMRFQQDEIVGIFGANGAGKTTFFAILTSVIFPEFGRLTLDGEDITSLKMWDRGRAGIVHLPQDSSVFHGLSVEDNIRAILQIRHESSNDVEWRLNELLETFSLTHLRKVMAPRLSGGERRKVEIARALAAEPVFLMLDEPFAGLDPMSIHEITNLIQRVRSLGSGVIITDHNVRETMRILDKVYVMTSGKVLASGTPSEILANDDVRRAYMGEISF